MIMLQFPFHIFPLVAVRRFVGGVLERAHYDVLCESITISPHFFMVVSDLFTWISFN